MDLLKPIKLLAFDVDGVLTRGEMIFGPDGDTKIYNVQDGLGIDLALAAGLEIALITGNNSDAIARRAKVLRIAEAYLGQRDKTVALHDLAKRKGLSMEEIAYVGDDLNDLPALKLAGAAFAVANAVPEVKAAADYITERSGGQGAAREIIEQILKAQGRWDEVVQLFLDELKEEDGAKNPRGAVVQ